MLENTTLKIDGDVLTITVRLDGPVRPSRNRHRPGKTVVVASTNGTVPLIDEDGSYRPEQINMSVWRAPTQRERLEFGVYRTEQRR